MSLFSIHESPSLFLSSTPIRASQDSFANSPVDSMVPKTPSIVSFQYCSDQWVPITPVTQVVLRSPAKSESVPGTPVNSVTTTPVATEQLLCFDKQDENLSDCQISVDQIVPSTPEGNASEINRKVNYYGHSSLHSTILHKNIGSRLGDSDSFGRANPLSKDAALHPRRFSRKRLSLSKSESTLGCSSSAHQSLLAIPTSQTSVQSSHASETMLVQSDCSSVFDYCSQPTEENSVLPERLTSQQVDLDLPSKNASRSPSLTSVSTSFMFPSVSTTPNATFTANTSMSDTPSGVSIAHIREEVTRMRRPFSQIRESQFFQAENEAASCHDSGQLKLFDGDDIFG